MEIILQQASHSGNKEGPVKPGWDGIKINWLLGKLRTIFKISDLVTAVLTVKKLGDVVNTQLYSPFGRPSNGDLSEETS